MAKDPAVLFYTSDFLSGTFTMDYEQRGKYITLLCIQHQKGFLTEKDLRLVLEDTDTEIFDKFKLAEDGNYYNNKMKECADKRKSYSESRSNNRKGKTKDVINISKSYQKHINNTSLSYHKDMETGNENEDLNKDLTVNKNRSGNTRNIIDRALDVLLDYDSEDKQISNAWGVIEDVGGIDEVSVIMEWDEDVKQNWLNRLIKIK
jgi:hypothetical protein